MMKVMKRLIGLLLAVMLAAAMAVPAMAEEGNGDGGGRKIRIEAGASGIDVSQKTFQAYRILDATVAPGGVNAAGEGIAYSVPENTALKQFYLTYFSENVTADPDTERALFDSQVVKAIAALKNDSLKLQDFAKAALDAVKAEDDLKAGTGAPDGKDYVISGLELGYYLVQDTSAGTGDQASVPISALALDSVKDEETVIAIKASQPTIDKKIEEETESGDKTTTDHNQAAIGDTINYVLTSKVPDMIGYDKYYFVVTDRLSKGLTFTEADKSKINIELKTKTEDGTDKVLKLKQGQKDSLTDEDHYYVEVTEEKDQDGKVQSTTVKIVFHNFIQWREKVKAGTTITITYPAVLNEFAEIGTKPNQNSVILEYSNDPSSSGSGEDEPGENDPTGKTPEAETFTYVTGLKIQKIDGENDPGRDPMPLRGAQFKIEGTALNIIVERRTKFEADANGTYYKLKNGTYTETEPTDATKEQYESTETRYRLEETSEKHEVPGGHISYELTTGDDGILHFDGLPSGIYTITETKAPDGYNMLTEPLKLEIKAAFADGTADPKYVPTWSASLDGKDENVSIEDGIIKFTVENSKGTLLPETGGTGTKLLYLLGGALVIGAGALLVLKKRGEKE